MKLLPKTITHISSGATFKVISMNLGGKVKVKCLTKGRRLIRKGSIDHIDIDLIDGPNLLYVSPVGKL